MQKIIRLVALCVCAVLSGGVACAQGVHFTQYYHAPMLLSPANTGLTPDKDFRVGANYRNQWAAVPVPYTTTAVYGDVQATRNRNDGNSWLGLGFAVFNDKVGDGELSLMRSEAFAAYHVLLNDYSMISAGVSAAWCQRSVNFSVLSFDEQWDGFSFSSVQPSGEAANTVRTTYADVGVGSNYAWFPTEQVYIKAGVGFAHLNQPVETFYSTENKIGIRSTANIDALFRIGTSVILNPSFYYTRQTNAQELMYGSLVHIAIGEEGRPSGQLIFGAFNRWDDALVGAVGYQLTSGLRALASYDVNITELSVQARGTGAFELGLLYHGIYSQERRPKNIYGCPRF